MIKLKTQLTATVSQKDIEVIIQEMINKQLGAGTVITDALFIWGDNSVTVTGTQKDLSNVDISKIITAQEVAETQDVTSTNYKVEPVSEIPFDVIEAVVNQPVAVLDSPFTPIVKDNVFTKVAAAKEAIGISTESSFPSVTLPNKFQLQ